MSQGTKKNTDRDKCIDIGTLTKILHNGVIVHIIQIDNITSEENYALVHARIMVNAGVTPTFGDIKLKMSKQALSKLKSGSKKIPPKKDCAQNDSIE